MAFAARLLKRLLPVDEQNLDDARRTSSGMLFAIASKQNHALNYMHTRSIDGPDSLRITLQSLMRVGESPCEKPTTSN